MYVCMYVCSYVFSRGVFLLSSLDAVLAWPPSRTAAQRMAVVLEEVHRKLLIELRRFLFGGFQAVL